MEVARADTRGTSRSIFDLAGRVALVSGASSGLGAHFATVLARAGARVILAARRVDRLAQLSAQIAAAGGRSEVFTLDVQRLDRIEALAAAHGNVDILVNNAGITKDGFALEQSEQGWDLVMGTNLKGMFLLSQAIVRTMREGKRGGSIINIASILGERQASGVLPYAVSKAGVLQMTKTLALEWARYGIRVNALLPGYFATDINRQFWESDQGQNMTKRIPMRRLGQLDDLDGPLLLLASDASRFMTGSTLTVDGGHIVSSL